MLNVITLDQAITGYNNYDNISWTLFFIEWGQLYETGLAKTA
jgi:hypothetical protein